MKKITLLHRQTAIVCQPLKPYVSVCTQTLACILCAVTNNRFVLQEPDSVRFRHDIILYLESDSFVVSFKIESRCPSVLVPTYHLDFFLSCIDVCIDNLRTRNHEYAMNSLCKSTKRTNPVSH